MKHLNEEQLIAYCDGETRRREVFAAHLSQCAECRAELERIEAILQILNTIPVPERGEDYGQRVWQQIAPRLPKRPPRLWELLVGGGWMAPWREPRRWAVVGTMVALVVAAFIAGRVTKRNGEVPVANAAQLRERVLLVAVGEHLGRSEMVLVELSNAEPKAGETKKVNISAEQRRAEDLLEENRLYRQTAQEQGNRALASVLDELERVLLDVAHSPGEVTPSQLAAIQQRIEARGILFKVRVVGNELQQRRGPSQPAPAQKDSAGKERNKA